MVQVYFRREGLGGNYLCGQSPTEEQVEKKLRQKSPLPRNRWSKWVIIGILSTATISIVIVIIVVIVFIIIIIVQECLRSFCKPLH